MQQLPKTHTCIWQHSAGKKDKTIIARRTARSKKFLCNKGGTNARRRLAVTRSCQAFVSGRRGRRGGHTEGKDPEAMVRLQHADTEKTGHITFTLRVATARGVLRSHGEGGRRGGGERRKVIHKDHEHQYRVWGGQGDSPSRQRATTCLSGALHISPGWRWSWEGNQ